MLVQHGVARVQPRRRGLPAERNAGPLLCARHRRWSSHARFYIACLLLNDAHYYQVGGLSADGRDMMTDMSYLVLEAADWLNASCNITVRVHEGMDMGLLRQGVKYLSSTKTPGRAFPAMRRFGLVLCERAIRPILPAAASRWAAIG